MSLLGKVCFQDEPFPYTFPYTFDTFQVGQIWDDTEEDWAWEIHQINTHMLHEDVHMMLSTDVFPPNGEAPAGPFTQVVLLTRPFNQAKVIS